MNPDLHKQCIDMHLHVYIHMYINTHTHTTKSTNETTEAIALCAILANKNYFYSRDVYQCRIEFLEKDLNFNGIDLWSQPRSRHLHSLCGACGVTFLEYLAFLMWIPYTICHLTSIYREMPIYPKGKRKLLDKTMGHIKSMHQPASMSISIILSAQNPRR